MQKYLIPLLLSITLINVYSFNLKPDTENQPQLTQRCTDVLPYPKTRIPKDAYYTWFGKLGEQLNGTTYEPGHVFARHIAVNGQCTEDQKKENKTVFLNED
jgi:hypothetical protein